MAGKVISGKVNTGIYRDVEVDTELGGIAVRQYIWNTSSLAWEKATGGAGAGNVNVTNWPSVQTVQNYYSVSLYEFTWTNVTTVNQPPDGTDTAIDISQARDIAIQWNTQDANNTATDVDLHVIMSNDESSPTYTDYDKSPTDNLGDNQNGIFYPPVGAHYMKLRLSENGSLAAYVGAKVKVRR